MGRGFSHIHFSFIIIIIQMMAIWEMSIVTSLKIKIISVVRINDDIAGDICFTVTQRISSSITAIYAAVWCEIISSTLHCLCKNFRKPDNVFILSHLSLAHGTMLAVCVSPANAFHITICALRRVNTPHIERVAQLPCFLSRASFRQQ